MKRCANCGDTCPSERRTVQTLNVYDFDTEEYIQVSVVQALLKFFRPKTVQFNENSEAKDHYFCLACKDLFLELWDAYQKFTSVSTAAGYVYELIHEHEIGLGYTIAKNLNTDDDDERNLSAAGIKIEVGCPEDDGVDCSAFLQQDQEIGDDDLDFKLESTTSNPNSGTKIRYKKRRYKKKFSAGETDTKRSPKRSRKQQLDKGLPSEETDADPSLESKKEQPDPDLTPIEYKCIDCPGEIFTSIPLWRQHQQTIHKRYFPRKTIRIHKERKNPKPHLVNVNYKPCPICGRGFSSSLGYHIENAHGTSEKPPEKCSICGLNLKTKWILKTHMQRFHNPEAEPEQYFCSICFQSFKSKNSLNTHEAVHRGEHKLKFRYECEVCHEKFATKSKVLKHQTKHTDERPCVCEQCGKAFKDKRQLDSHFKRLHTERRKDKLCDICGKGFSVASRLKEHLMGVHKLSLDEANQRAQVKLPVLRLNEEDANEFAEKLKAKSKPSPICDLCGKKYSRREYLLTHLIKGHNMTKEEAFRVTGLETVRDLLGSPGHGAGGQLLNQTETTEPSFLNLT